MLARVIAVLIAVAQTDSGYRAHKPERMPRARRALDERPSSSIDLKIVGLRSREGQILVLLWDDPQGFPDRQQAARSHRVIPLNGKDPRIQFEDLPMGTYAITLVHDENKNGRLDTNFLGIPTEGYGCSNNRTPRLSRPRYTRAKFRIGPGRATKTVRITYL